MSILSDYNLAAVQVTLGSFRVTGWAADDAANVTPMSDLNESQSSADGAHVSVSRINDPRWECTLTVRRGTAAYRHLIEALQAQLVQSNAGAIEPLAFQIFDPVSGDKINEKNIRFMRYPDLPFAKTASDAEFKLLLPKPTIIGGANIDLTV